MNPILGDCGGGAHRLPSAAGSDEVQRQIGMLNRTNERQREPRKKGERKVPVCLRNADHCHRLVSNQARPLECYIAGPESKPDAAMWHTQLNRLLMGQAERRSGQPAQRVPRWAYSVNPRFRSSCRVRASSSRARNAWACSTGPRSSLDRSSTHQISRRSSGVSSTSTGPRHSPALPRHLRPM